MKKAWFLASFLLLLATAVSAQLTIKKNGKEFFNGDDRHLRVYLNNNYQNLDPIEGVWVFTRIEMDDYGYEVSRTPNEITAAIVRDAGNLRRAFVEVNLSRAFCKEYQITYSIQTGGGSGFYPCQPEGCNVISGQYYFDPTTQTLSRPAVSFLASKAVLVGIKTFPQGPPTEILPYPGGTTASDPAAQVTPKKARTIASKSGWEPLVDWGNQIFPSYILSMGTIDPKTFAVADDYLGDPLSVVGILIKNPRPGSEIEIEIESTKYTKKCNASFKMPKKGEQYAIFPKISWDYDLLRCATQATPLDFTFHVSVNGKKAESQTITANLRAIDDCPLSAFDYRGEPIDLKFLAAAFVNEGSPIVKNLTKELKAKGLIWNIVGQQGGGAEAIQQVYAFWKGLRDKGISYSSITNNGQQDNSEVFSQRIRLLEDVMEETQANCVDGTALFASCLGLAGIPPVMVFVPGHAFLGYIPSYNQEGKPNVFYLETTMLGGAAAVPAEFESVVANEPYRTFRQILREKFADGRRATDLEIDYFVLASIAADQTFIKNANENPEKVMTVFLNEARQFVKPIYRCGATNAPVNTTERTTYQPQPQPEKTTVLWTNKDGNQPVKSERLADGPSQWKRKGTESYDSGEFMTDAADQQDEVFKIQLEVTPKWRVDKPEYSQMREYGAVYPEYLLEKQRYRAMVGSFPTQRAALKAAKKAQSLGFGNVAIVRYFQGNRYESIYRDWKIID